MYVKRSPYEHVLDKQKDSRDPFLYRDSENIFGYHLKVRWYSPYHPHIPVANAKGNSNIMKQ